MHKIEMFQKEITVDQLLTFYNHDKVEGYCKHCQNYGKIWSCPPHDFDSYEYLVTFKSILIMGAKITFIDEISKEERLEIFQDERRKFSDKLMAMEDNSIALIAGNCYQCKTCSRLKSQPCILHEQMRYSLEALGLMVGEISKQVLNIELKWTSHGKNDYWMTLGGLLTK